MQAYAGYKENGEYVPGTLRDSENQALGQLVAVTKLSQIKLAKCGYYVAEVKINATLEETNEDLPAVSVVEERPEQDSGPTVSVVDAESAQES